MYTTLRKKFIKFFTAPPRNHREIPSSPIIPDNDPTVLFITAGMHPLVPYLLGETHPLGKRLVDIQKSMRTDDLEEVGDARHFTFFEMLGNWSLGDYFKKEAIEWSFDFLTNKIWLNFDPFRLYVSVFEGDSDSPRDEESIEIWKKVFASAGIRADIGNRIFLYPKSKNWWGPAGTTGPCGPDTEMFYDTKRNVHDEKIHGPVCHINCDCGRYVEVWNDVFMQYNKNSEGVYEVLKQKNVDTGMGMERTVTLLEWLNGDMKEPDPFTTELFKNEKQLIEKLSGKSYTGKFVKSIRIILDHLRAATFIIADGVEPSNKERGYILRRLIRRAVRHGHLLNMENEFACVISESFIQNYKKYYPELVNNKDKILVTLKDEEMKFRITLSRGLKEIEKYKYLDGKIAFNLYQSFGFPLELTMEIAKERNQEIDKKTFTDEFIKHQKLSRTATKGVFKGGLQDHSEKTTKLHTTTHLLQQALRMTLGDHVRQKGSHITADRLRFDFSHPQKITAPQIEEIEKIINNAISKNMKVNMDIVDFKQAAASGALTVPGVNYPEKVKVYTIGLDPTGKHFFSREVCGGPHVDFTGKLGKFKILKEEALGKDTRRIYATLIDLNVSSDRPSAKKGG